MRNAEGSQIIGFCLKRLKSILTAGMSVIGGLWSVITIAEVYYPDYWLVKLCGSNIFCLIIPAAVVMVLSLIGQIVKIFFLGIKYDNVRVGIRVGNILNKSDGVIVVGVNNQFITDENKIGKTSIHNQVVKQYGQDKIAEIFNKNNKAEVRERLFFQERIDDKEFLFLLMSDLDDNGVASTTQEQIGRALDSLFNNQSRLRLPHPQKCIYLPVLGTGETGRFRVDNKDIIFIISKFLQNEKREADVGQRKICKLYVVVYWKDIVKVNWDSLHGWLKLMQTYCIECNKFIV